MFGIHVVDILVIVAYLALVLVLGHRAARRSSRSQEDYFLAGRKLGKVYQFFLNFGNATDANGAVSATSVVYQQGVSGVWIGFQLIFLNPYYWFMNLWFRRVRLVTMADLFEDRLGSRHLASFYALFQSLSAIFVIIGFGNLVTYKISSALIVKPESAWTVIERTAVEDYQELHRLEVAVKQGRLQESDKERLRVLRDREARGEVRSFITALDPLSFYIVYTLVVGLYVMAGGMAATAVNEVLQSLIIVAFSIVLIPFGLNAIGGAAELSQKVPAAMFELIGSAEQSQKVTGLSLFALFLVAIVQINGIIGNMGIGGSAKNEFAARFGAVTGTYAKRLMFIMWSFAGLIAVALYQGPQALSDPDLAWGTMSRQLLGPGLLGLMITGVLAANMSTVAAQTVSISALVVRNLIRPLCVTMSDNQAVRWGRITMFSALSLGIVAASLMNDVVSGLLLVQTVTVPLGATVLLMFFWRRLTVPAVWVGLCLSIALTIILPLLAPKFEAVREHPYLTVRATDANGKFQPIFFENVVRVDPLDGASPLVGQGRLHVELLVLEALGLPIAKLSTSDRFAGRLFVDVAIPFLLLIGISLVTRPPEKKRVDEFFGRMKTPVGATPQLDQEAVAESVRNPHRFDHQKLFPSSSWEFTRWDKVDTIGFLACCAVSASIIALFWWLLQLAAGR